MKAIFLVILMFSFSSVFAEYKVGIINIKKIMNDISEGKKVNEKLTSSFKSKEKILKDEEAKIKKAQEDFQKQDMVLSDKAKMAKQKELQEMIIKYQQKTQEYQKQMQKEEADLKKPILEKLSSVVDDVSKKEGVEMTFEASTSPVVYVKTKVDLTSKIIEAYNKKHK